MQWPLLLLLSHFSRVWLHVTPQTPAHQAPPSLGFSRQEHWSGLPFPPQCMKVKSESEVAQSCLTLQDPMDCSPPGSSVHGIFQARVLEWGAIAFSGFLYSVRYFHYFYPVKRYLVENCVLGKGNFIEKNYHLGDCQKQKQKQKIQPLHVN